MAGSSGSAGAGGMSPVTTGSIGGAGSNAAGGPLGTAGSNVAGAPGYHDGGGTFDSGRASGCDAFCVVDAGNSVCALPAPAPGPVSCPGFNDGVACGNVCDDSTGHRLQASCGLTREDAGYVSSCECYYDNTKICECSVPVSGPVCTACCSW
jgi:hypothetical protein